MISPFYFSLCKIDPNRFFQLFQLYTSFFKTIKSPILNATSTYAKNFTVPIVLIDSHDHPHILFDTTSVIRTPMGVDNPGNAVRAFTTGWDARKWAESGHAPAIRKEKSDKVERERKGGGNEELTRVSTPPGRSDVESIHVIVLRGGENGSGGVVEG